VGGRRRISDTNNFLSHLHNQHILANSTIDEDTFLENFLQNQYPTDVKIEGINDDNRSEISVENNINYGHICSLLI
jgi:hypothetical protein